MNIKGNTLKNTEFCDQKNTSAICVLISILIIMVITTVNDKN